MNKFNPLQKDTNVDLAGLTTFGAKARAAYWVKVTQPEDIPAALGWVHSKNVPMLVLGGGSNVLFAADYPGAVLQPAILGRVLEPLPGSASGVVLRAGAGENWHKLVQWSVQQGLGGIENLALIPGNVGAAPMQNIGAYGVEFADVCQWVKFYDLETDSFRTFSSAECKFGYRDSIFKQELKGKVIITEVAMRLQKAPHQPNLGYASLQRYLQEHAIEQPGIEAVFKAVMAIRQSKLPDPAVIGNCGSFFKNPIVGKDVLARIATAHENVPSYPVDAQQVKIPAGWLIENAGLKGITRGRVGTYEKQALVLVNRGGASGEEAAGLAAHIQQTVAEKFGISLEPEVNILPAAAFRQAGGRLTETAARPNLHR